MTRKQAREHLRKVIRDWIESIDDIGLREKLKGATAIMGGALASLALVEEPNDYDIYINDYEIIEDVLYYYNDIIGGIEQDDREVLMYNETEPYEVPFYLRRWENNTLNGREDVNPYEIVCVTSSAITLYGGIQVVYKFSGSFEKIIERFDFEHCRAYYDYKNDKLEYTQGSLEAIAFKELRYVGSDYPVSSLLRTRKYIKRDWNISAGEYLKIILDIQQYNLLDPAVLRSQLVGVDMTYFMQLLAELEERKYEPLNHTSNELVELIDKIF